jgi:hypothetical protein
MTELEIRPNASSKKADKRIWKAAENILDYLKKTYPGYEFYLQKQITLYELKSRLNSKDLIPREEDKRNSMRPDGGIIFMKLNLESIPILVAEVKQQGRNDVNYKNGVKKKGLGNAIERAAKNLKAAEMMFHSSNLFPYAIFASGCDFHHTESIPSRLTMMNYGFPSHYIEIKPEVKINMDRILQEIDVTKKMIHGKEISTASIFVKAHKYDEMEYGSSDWTVDEYFSILKTILNQVLKVYL